jgi:hypothetical protein
MSAFLCTDQTVYNLASALLAAGLADDLVSCAQSLRDANNKALRARYGDPAQPLGPIGKLARTVNTLPELNTLARCFRYQCAEGDVLETHPAMPALAALIDATGGETAATVQAVWSTA